MSWVRVLSMCCVALGLMAQDVRPKDLALRWDLIENATGEPARFRGTFTLTNEGQAPLPLRGWALHFNMGHPVLPASVTQGWRVEHLGGDLQRLVPLGDFKPLAPRASVAITLEAEGWAVNRYDTPAGPYLVLDNQPHQGHALGAFRSGSLQGRDLRRAPDDHVKPLTPQERFARNAMVDRQAPTLSVLPKPKRITRRRGSFLLSARPEVVAPPALAHEAAWARTRLLPRFTIPTKDTPQPIRLVLGPVPGETSPEAYHLVVDSPTGISITAPTPAGVFYGLQSLDCLLPMAQERARAIPCVDVVDAPRFGYRGLHLDVARNFLPKQDVLRVLDLMARYKLNTFHFHLTDDEGWRFEVPGLPELTTVGAVRGHGAPLTMLPPTYGSGPDPRMAPGSGHYTRGDMVEILRAATERHIEVMVELEMPGHARAAIQAMEARAARLRSAGDEKGATAFLLRDPQDRSTYRSVQLYSDNVIDPGLPSTYAFISHVVDQVAAMYRDAGAPLRRIHVGGDEKPEGSWKASPACLAAAKDLKSTDDLWHVFYDRVDRILRERGIGLAAWEEAAMRRTLTDGIPRQVPNPEVADKGWQIYVWNNVIGSGAEDLAYRLANGGHKVVLTMVSNLYLDMAYEPDPEAPGQYWGGYADIDAPFRFIPLDYFLNTTQDANGNPLDKAFFKDKERLTPQGRNNIVGIQGCLWSETILDTPTMERLLLPRLLGVAERAWAPNPTWAQQDDPQTYTQDWSTFMQQVAQQALPRLDQEVPRWHFHLPPPGLRVSDQGLVEANHAYPGMVLRYTEDGREPTRQSPVLNQPIRPKGRTITVAAFTPSGRRSPSATLNLKP